MNTDNDKPLKIKKYLPNFDCIPRTTKSGVESDKLGKRYISLKIYNWLVGRIPTTTNSEDGKANRRVWNIFGSSKPTTNNTIINGKGHAERVASSLLTSKTIELENKPDELYQKKEIEVIFSRQRISNNLIHGQRSGSVRSLVHDASTTFPASSPNTDRASNSFLLFSQSHPMEDKNINLYTKLFNSSNNGKVATLPEELVVAGILPTDHRPLLSMDNSSKSFGLCSNKDASLRAPNVLKGCDPKRGSLTPRGVTDRVSSEGGYNVRKPSLSNFSSGEASSEVSSEPEKWVPPDKHGLENSDRIIPIFYIPSNMTKNNILRVDYHYMILDDIRNVRPLNEYQLNYIKNYLQESEKHSIIEEFNNVILSYGEILSNDT